MPPLPVWAQQPGEVDPEALKSAQQLSLPDIESYQGQGHLHS